MRRGCRPTTRRWRRSRPRACRRSRGRAGCTPGRTARAAGPSSTGCSLALDAERATFAFVEPEEATQSALRTWGVQHAGLWAALVAAGRAVDVVVVSRNLERLAAARRVLDGWVSSTAAADGCLEAVAAELAERTRRNEEIASIRTAIATLDGGVLASYGGLNGAVARCAALATAATVTKRVRPMITTGRTWLSERVPE